MNSNPLIPGGKKISPLGKSMINATVDIVGRQMGLDKDNLDLRAELQVLMDKSKIANANFDHAGFLYYIQHGIFLSLFCGDEDMAVQFAKDYVLGRHPGVDTSDIDLALVNRFGGAYAGILIVISEGNLGEFSKSPDFETVVRSVMSQKHSVHDAAKIVGRQARFMVYREALDNIDLVRNFSAEIHQIGMNEPINFEMNSMKLKGSYRQVLAMWEEKYQRCMKEDTPTSHAGWIMQVIYDYAAGVNVGMFSVGALRSLLEFIAQYAIDNNAIRLGDIPLMIEEDFEPNPNYASDAE